MGRANWLADKLRAIGLQVVEVDGWQTRGSSTFNPQGVVVHHTAGAPTGDAPSLGICIRGRSDLPGPLCNVFLSRSGIAYVVASGRANHAGPGGAKGLSGNSSVFGIEAENTGRGEPWSAAQLEAFYRICAVMLAGIGKDSSWVIAHREWTTRKIDPQGIDMNAFRGSVNARMHPAPPTTYPVLREGDSGCYVALLQDRLRFVSGAPRVTDGKFGPATKTAVKNFQTYLKLESSGTVGPKTWDTLNWCYAAKGGK